MPEEIVKGIVVAVSLDATHAFSKANRETIRLLAGLGVEGDAHMGQTVQHRSRIAKNPAAPNLRQVHLMHSELHDELRLQGFEIGSGQLGENITTRGIALLDLTTGTRLFLGKEAVVQITGLRNPCIQIERFQPGLQAAVLGRDDQGKLVRKAGVMGIVLETGEVSPGDAIRVEFPAQPHLPLEPV